MKQFKWRMQKVIVKAGESKEVYFDNPRPNVFWIRNLADENIYIGVDYIPSEKSFDRVILSKSDDIIGRPSPTDRLFVFNPSKEDIHMIFYSDSVDFDFNFLKNKIECFITGVKEGTTFHVMNEYLEKLASTIKTASNGENFLKVIGVEDIIINIKKIANCCNPSTLNVYYTPSYSYVAGTINSSNYVTFNSSTFKFINYISNDSDENVTIEFNKNSNNLISLKSGEVINNVTLAINTIRCYGENINVRYLITDKA